LKRTSGRPSILQLEAVSAGYGESRVLWDISFEVVDPSAVVIVGPNGAGKSTLLKVVNGLLPVRSGRVLFDGEEITDLPPHERPGRGIAACPEGRRLFPNLTAEENLKLGAYPARARDSAEETLEYVYRLFPQLRARAGVKAARLSGGEQQMVGIGRALMAKPKILVLDEPSLGLAPKIVSEIFEKIRLLREQGLSVLMVEQNAYQALRIADFGHVVQGGRILRSGPPSDLMDLEELRKAYFAIG
jgi:branched-chain amino acid transport system ATP-binding protein